MSVLLPFLLIFPFVFFGPASAAHRQLVLQSTSATPSATALASAFGYAYIGCWNETTGPRNDGRAEPLEAEGKKMVRSLMTIEMCLEYCSSGKRDGRTLQYAGLSKGRECHCKTHPSEYSGKVNDSTRCAYSCSGNSSQPCGGPGALTLYNLTAEDEDSQTGIAWSQFSGAAGYGTLAVITLVIAAIM